MNAIGYPELNLGLNNQKLALFGLFGKAIAEKLNVALPQLSNFDAIHGKHILVDFGDIYSISRLRLFASTFGIEILDQPPLQTDGGWGLFIGGSERLGRDAIRGEAYLDDFACQFFRNLVPVITGKAVFRKLEQAVFLQNNVRMVLQLRIENDWIAEASNIKSREVQFHDEYDLDYTKILKKLKTTFQNDELGKTIYVVCDEDNLPVSKQVIREEALRLFGFSLLWKSDILSQDEMASLSILEKSIIDFDMAVRASVFVGFSRSSFANLANFENFCRNGTIPQHYIYNQPGATLGKRCDYGTHVNPAEVTNPLYLRAALVADSAQDCLWPASLTAHFSHIGDFTARTGVIDGTRKGRLALGVAGDLNRMIEGFVIEFSNDLHGGLEYCARLADGQWGPWVAAGEYAGTRSLQQTLRGFAVRLTGRLALGYQCICAGSFEGHDEIVIAQDGQNCTLANNSQMQAMQVTFRPVSAYSPLFEFE